MGFLEGGCASSSADSAFIACLARFWGVECCHSVLAWYMYTIEEWRTLLWPRTFSLSSGVSDMSMAACGSSFTAKMSSSGSMIGVDICVGCRGRNLTVEKKLCS